MNIEKTRGVSLRFCPTELDEGNEVWNDLGFDPTEAERRKRATSRDTPLVLRCFIQTAAISLVAMMSTPVSAAFATITSPILIGAATVTCSMLAMMSMIFSFGMS